MRIIGALLLTILVASGATYYVDPDAGNDGNSGLATNLAWQYIPGASNYTGTTIFTNGDSIIVKGGSTNTPSVRLFQGNTGYRFFNATPGTRNAILIQSGHLAGWGSGMAKLDCGSNYTTGFYIHASGITLDGFEVFNTRVGTGDYGGEGNCCIQMGWDSHGTAVSNITVRGCWLHDSPRGGVEDRGHGFEFDAPITHTLIESNIVGPQIGTKGIDLRSTPNYGAIRYNYFYDWRDHGVSFGAARWDINNNVFFAIVPFVHNPVYAFKIAPVFGNTNNDIWNNLIFTTNTVADGTGTCGIGILDNGGTGSTKGNRILHNTVYRMFTSANNGREADALVMGGSAGPTSNNIVANNLFIQSQHTAISGYSNITVWIEANSRTNAYLYNDIWSQQDGERVVYDEEYYQGTVAGWQATFPAGGNTAVSNIQINPMFTGGTLPTGVNSDMTPNSDYFTLSAASSDYIKTTLNSYSGDALHGYETNADKFLLDIAGRTRTAWSMGAYEFFDASAASLAIVPSSYSVSALTNSVVDDTSYRVSNAGDTSQTITWSNAISAAWLSTSLAGGDVSTDTDTNVVSFDLTGLAQDVYTGYVTNFGWTNDVLFSTQLFTVTLTVTNGLGTSSVKSKIKGNGRISGRAKLK